jgi:glycosyltransferase involved in cell wall biosynthesis
VRQEVHRYARLAEGRAQVLLLHPPPPYSGLPPVAQAPLGTPAGYPYLETAMVQADSLQLLEAELADLLDGFPPIVCFGNDVEGDPTSKHHIMRILSRYVPVVWVESAGMRWPDLTSLSDLRRIGHRLHRAAVPPPAEGMRVLSPLSLPLPGNRAAEVINGWLYRRKITATLGAQSIPPLLWVYIPTVAPYLSRLPRQGLVYHCVDRWWAFTEYDSAVMRSHHAELCRSSDSTFASATELKQDCERYRDVVHLLPHGVEWEHFSAAALDELPRPADIQDLTGPVIGFFGLLHDWIDQELLVTVARAFPDATVLLIGKARVDLSELVKEPNVRWVGQKPYAELPAYAAAFNVGLIPFVQNELTAAVNPLKLREYLATGIPVVATPLPEVARLEGRSGLTVARSTEQFITALKAALDSPRTRAERAEAAMAQITESWVGRCIEMVRHIRSDIPLLNGSDRNPSSL